MCFLTRPHAKPETFIGNKSELMSYIPKFILNIVDNFSIKNIASWFQDLLNYLIAPRKFVLTYNSKTLENQISQLIFYVCLNCLSYFIFGAGQTQHELYRYISVILFTSVPFIILNVTTFFIVSKNEFSLWKIISYIFIGNLIFFIPMPFFLHLYIDNENYIFMFTVNILLLLMFLYFLIIIWFGFFNRAQKKIWGIIMNIFLFNTFYLAVGLSITDSFSKSNESSMDPIIDELNKHGQRIEFATVKIISFKSVREIATNSKSYYLEISINDTISNIDENGIKKLYGSFKKNQKYLNREIPKMHFERNKQIFESIKLYNKDLESFLENPKNQITEIERTNYKYKQSDKIEFVTDNCIISKSLSKNLDKFNYQLNELETAKDFSSSPITIVEKLLTPAYFVTEKLNLGTGKSVQFLIK